MKNMQVCSAIHQWSEKHPSPTASSTDVVLGKGRLRWCCFYCSVCYKCLCDICKLLWSGLQIYCKRGCLVGTRYLAEPNYHITERIFWIVILIISFSSGYYVIKRYLNTYERNVFQLIMEDRPMTHDVDFPTVGLCEHGIGYNEPFNNYKKSLYQEYPVINDTPHFKDFIDAFAFEDLIKDDVFGKFYKTVQDAPNLDTEYYNTFDYTTLTEKAHANCSELFLKCIWNETAFECCDYFRPVNTMIGPCFLLNSLQTENATFLDMRVTAYMERFYIKLIFNRSAEIFLLNSEDIPERATPFPKLTMMFAGQSGFMEFDLEPMINDRDITALSLAVRKCFSNTTAQADIPSNISLTYPYLSYTSCLTECVRHAQLIKCGCIHWHFNKGKGAAEAPYCDLRGYVCLERHELMQIFSMRKIPLPYCEGCLPSCNEANILFVNFDYVNENSVLVNNRSITISMLSFPQRQFRRQIVRGNLDIVVSLGGILSLFMGCNLLNFIELVFIVAREVKRGRRTY